VSVKTGNLSVTGAEHVGVFQSSEFAQRAFCNKCGSSLWYRLTAGKYVGNTSIPVGLLDEPDGLVLSTEYFVECKNSTDELPDGRTQITGAEVEKIIADFMGKDQT